MAAVPAAYPFIEVKIDTSALQPVASRHRVHRDRGADSRRRGWRNSHGKQAVPGGNTDDAASPFKVNPDKTAASTKQPVAAARDAGDPPTAIWRARRHHYGP